MPDDTPENVDLRFLAEQQARILGELAEMREQTKLIPQIAASVSELQRDVSELRITLAATRAVVGVIKETLEKVHETQQPLAALCHQLQTAPSPTGRIPFSGGKLRSRSAVGPRSLRKAKAPSLQR